MKKNTKPIPALITLIAAGISCLASIVQNVGLHVFTVRLFLTVIIFYVIGSIVKVVIDRGLHTMTDKDEKETSQEDEEKPKEDVQMDDEEDY